MIKVEMVEVMNFENALRGMRNPLNSWAMSDSRWDGFGEADGFTIGDNDLALAMKLANAGSDHRKFLRQILVSMDVTAPLYWWKEFDTYKVGTVANSCSTMHKIHAKEFTLDDFSCEHLTDSLPLTFAFEGVIKVLNKLREQYNNTGDKLVWYQMIQLLPTSYNQLRTVTLNYEVLRNIYHSRANHKLDEWRELCKQIELLPYSELITGERTHK